MEQLTLEKYSNQLGATNKIQRILIATNGIAAVKVIHSIKQWCYETFGNENLMQFVVMATPEDIKANAEYIRLSNRFVEVKDGPSYYNYGNVDLIVDIAEQTKVHAVFPGWGHASENPKLPLALSKSEPGISFIGPTHFAMSAMGDKIYSTLIAQGQGIPTVPWSGGDFEIKNIDENGIDIYQQLYTKSCVQNIDESIEISRKIGFPVMIKACSSGGGKGIRKANNEEELVRAYAQVRYEVPGSSILIMKFVNKCRHIEVQIVGDKYGNIITLSGRDCTTQRRHQKIVEEGPPSIPRDVMIQMESCSKRLARAAGYTSVGTVEFLYLPDSDLFYFLEFNPRLQVEHTVTEVITQTNLPALQLQIAMGIPLFRIPMIRKIFNLGKKLKEDFNENENQNQFENEIEEDNPFQKNLFQNKNLPKLKGHAIAVRITSENPEKGFEPTNGSVEELTFRSISGVWGYFSILPLGAVHKFSDTQIGHVFSWGKTRAHARKKMIVALKQLSIRGEIRTPVGYLIQLLENELFKKNHIHTQWVDALLPSETNNSKSDPLTPVVCVGVYKAQKMYQLRKTRFIEFLERRQMPQKELFEREYDVSLIHENMKYDLEVEFVSEILAVVKLRNNKTLQANTLEVEMKDLSDHGLILLFSGKSHICYVQENEAGTALSIDNTSWFFPNAQDPSIITAPFPGKLVRIVVGNGENVEKGNVVAEMETMKMILPVFTRAKGTIIFVKEEGAILATGDIIASLKLPNLVRRESLETFQGTFPNTSKPRIYGNKIHQSLQQSLERLRNIMAGFSASKEVIFDALSIIEKAFKDETLPLLEFKEILSNITERIPLKLENQFVSFEKNIRDRLFTTQNSHMDNSFQYYPCGESIMDIIDSYLNSIKDSKERRYLSEIVQDLSDFADKYKNGLRGSYCSTLQWFLDQYYDIERHFQGDEDDLMVLERLFHFFGKNKFEQIYRILFSHYSIRDKNSLILEILAIISRENDVIASLSSSLQNLCLLQNMVNLPVSLRAKQILNQYQNNESNIDLESMKKMIFQKVQEYQLTEDLSPQDGNKIKSRLYELINKFLPLVTELDIVEKITSSLISCGHYSHDHQILEINKKRKDPYLLVCWDFYRLHQNLNSNINSNPNLDLNSNLNSNINSNLNSNINSNPNPNTNSNINLNSNIDLNSNSNINSNSNSNINSNSNSNINSNSNLNSNPNPNPNSNSNPNQNKIIHLGMVSFLQTPHNLTSYHFEQILANFQPKLNLNKGIHSKPGNTIMIITTTSQKNQNQLHFPTFDENQAQIYQSMVKQFYNKLIQLKIKSITFLVIQNGLESPGFYTFTSKMDFAEDKTIRHVYPLFANDLELPRLSSYNVTPLHMNCAHIHLYHGEFSYSKNQTQPSRLFIRSVLPIVQHFQNDLLHSFHEIIKKLEILQLNSVFRKSDFLHIFINILPLLSILDEKETQKNTSAFLKKVISEISSKISAQLYKLKVIEIEIYVNIRNNDTSNSEITSQSEKNHSDKCNPLESSRYRIFISIFSPFSQDIEVYSEQIFDGQKILKWIDGTSQHPGQYHDKPSQDPYGEITPIQRKRAFAKKAGTTYIYDFLKLFQCTIEKIWNEFVLVHHLSIDSIPKILLEYEEFVLQESILPNKEKKYDLNLIKRSDGNNKIGMVAWKVKIKTPEFEKREIVLIGNDITFQIGSFGFREDMLFKLVSQYSRRKKIPQVYISANSGARIGLSKLIKDRFQVEWNNPDDLEQGFQYLYLNEEDNKKLNIISEFDDIGVVNLQGSGMIAGETSSAYTECFTISYVTGRAVGIGSYLVRLGQRVIQKNDSPIILTGAQALNKLLGSNIYTSNIQIGGPQIMGANGISHRIVQNDLEGIEEILKWLSFIPKKKGKSLPIHLSSLLQDPIEREIEFIPPNEPYDPVNLLNGAYDPKTQKWISGLCDKGSFIETLEMWAQTVRVGRCRLGGIPLGIIVPELRTVTSIIPADPANLKSEETTILQAGQLWYPDSAFKTAQAIRDFDQEELPLLIFANFRGFSGGLRDMFHEVLKFGSMIVDNLRTYKNPIVVYLPPYSELRGGAWVVLDPKINLNGLCEMFADPSSKGGVLEPTGTIEIKYKNQDLISTMHRLDPVLIQLEKTLNDPNICNVEHQRNHILSQISERENKLLPIFTQIATKFADLHDTPVQMKHRKVIKEVIEWKNARSYFYYHFSRKIQELNIYKKLISSGVSKNLEHSSFLFQKWIFKQNDFDHKQFLDNKLFISYLLKKKEDIQKWIQDLSIQFNSSFDKILNEMKSFLDNISVENRKQFIEKINLEINEKN
ncbi:acetyl-coa carboxylase isoform a [Anaeramoeba ignava]|uniref:Acetyl-coa carboxylase isoform a n=1 Tax=Anaeramoeba ignava TaxID=1746090 RepID=A0A9Q0R5P6_ANAIG|nr:acetyl-coa carboxylase isoform a [Anaeramoeba ignava]